MVDTRFGKYLTRDEGLTRKFRQIANDQRVVVYNNREMGMLELHYKGKRIMELPHGNTSRSHQEVRDHFKHLRTSTRYKYIYDNYAKQQERKEAYLKGEQDDFCKEMAEEMMINEFGHGPRSVVVNKKD